MATTKVTANVLADNSVTQAKLADDAVGAAELAANAVVNASIASGAAIDMDKLDGDSLANAITDFAQDDLVILSDTSDSGNLVKMTTSNFEDAIFGNISGDVTLAAGGAATLAAAQTNITSVLNTSLVLGRDGDNQIKFGTDNQIIFEVDGGDNVIFKTSGEIEASSLDISGDVDVDGTLEADAITINGTTLAETISDTVGAMVGSNTETGIAVSYDDSDNTLDFVIGAGVIVNSMLADDAVGADELAANAVVTASIVDDNVTQAKIADDAVGADQLAANAVVTASITDANVTTAKIAADAITGAKIADDAINSEHYTDGSIDTAHIADDQITAAKVASDLRAVTYIGIDAGDYIQWTADTQTDFYVNGNNEMRLEADGDLHVDGDVIGYSTTIGSDEKLKTDITVIDNPLDKLKQINGVTFNYKRNNKPSGGVIAQNLEKVMPSVVGTQKSLNGSEEFKTVDYNAVIGLLIESVKELEQKLNNCNCK